MDIHRCRFVPYPPSAINALAFSHPSSLESGSRGPTTLRLAIGRANGDIEIWNPQKGAWFQESVLKGGKGRSIEGLVWTQDPEDEDKNGKRLPGKLRLFSIGYSTSVTEWDLATGLPARHCTANYGEIWCITAQPRQRETLGSSIDNGDHKQHEPGSHHQNIAVGCADGAVVIFSTAHGELQFLRTLTTSSSKKARVLSISYQNPHVVITGHADSTIRVFDVRSRQLLRSMSLGAGPAGGPKEILVWSVRCACDGTIVSGDSTGTVRFWDGQTYTMVQRIKGHAADVLDVAISVDGKSAISGSMDRRTTLYRRGAIGKKGEKTRWKEIMHQRLHKHDVKALAAFETSQFSVLASGGLDSKPIITPIQQFGKEFHRTLSALPQRPPISSARSRRLMVSWWDREIGIWKIPRSREAHEIFEDDSQSDGERRIKLVSRIELQNEENLTSVDISADGQLLVVATLLHVKSFRLRYLRGSTVKVRKSELPRNISSVGAKIVSVSPDNRWLLIVRPDSTIELHRLFQAKEAEETTKVFERCVYLKRLKRSQMSAECTHGTHGEYDRSVSRVAFSADSRILAVGDLSGYIDTWVLEGHENLMQQDVTTNGVSSSASSDADSSESDEEQHPLVIFGQRWIRNPAASLLPRLQSTPTVLAFRPAPQLSENLLNGHALIHATRLTPNPHSHDLPKGEDRLFVLTSEHQMHEVEVLAGRLSDWSRRNPTSSLPPEFRILDERTMGFVWDVAKGKERIWLYGGSWLWMFDLSQDLSNSSIPAETASKEADTKYNTSLKKRKRRLPEPRNEPHYPSSKRGNTGAGDRIPTTKLSSGLGWMTRRTEGAESADAEWTNLNRQRSQISDDDNYDDCDHLGDSTLAKMRRGEGEEILGKDKMALNGAYQENDGKAVMAQITGQRPPHWCTNKYRPILGIVPLSGGLILNEDTENEQMENECGDEELEIALVERPFEEADLPARYYGEQEWDEPHS